MANIDCTTTAQIQVVYCCHIGSTVYERLSGTHCFSQKVGSYPTTVNYELEYDGDYLIVWLSPIEAIRQGLDVSATDLPDEYKALLSLMEQ